MKSLTLANPEQPRHLELLSGITLQSKGGLPLHAQLKSSLERLIYDHFEDQSRFYSEAQLMEHFGLSQGTVRRAMADLASQGLLDKKPSRGTIVCKGEETTRLAHLAVFLPDYSSPTVADFLTHLTEESLHRNIQVQPIYTHRGERLLKAYNELKFSPRTGAALLLENSSRATLELATALEEKGYDYVVMGTPIKNTTFKFVGGCNRTPIFLGMDHLVGLGHRRIALLVSEPEEKENVQERIAAFEEYAAQSKIPLEITVARARTRLWEDAFAATDRLMEPLVSATRRPTAFFAVSDVGALAAIKWLQSRGFQLPRDFSILGTDGIPVAHMLHPALTTMTYPGNMVREVFELLSARDVPERKIFIKPKLVVRESTAAPAGCILDPA